LNSHIFQEVINYIPVGITLFIFFAFLKTNKNVKEFEAGPIKYKAKDDNANKNEISNKDANSQNNKGIEQDKSIDGIMKKLEKLESLIERSAADIKKRDAELDTRLDKQYEYLREAALKSCIAIVFSDNVPLVEFLDAVFTSLYLGANGNTIGRVTKRIIKNKETLETYNSELAKFRKEHKKTNAHFESAIRQIHDEWH